MPKLTDREQLAQLEAKQRKVAQEIDEARGALRGRYGGLVADIAVEQLTEKEFKDILAQAVRTGGAAAIAALKPLPARPS